MITEDYVSFETAKLLKEKGFESDECIAIYDMGDNNAFIRDSGIFENGPEDYLDFQWGEEWKRFGYYLAPTLQMAMKWLRKNYNIYITAVPNGIGENVFYMGIYKKYDYGWTYISDCLDEKFKEAEFYTPEEACEAAIKYCLENLI